MRCLVPTIFFFSLIMTFITGISLACANAARADAEYGTPEVAGDGCADDTATVVASTGRGVTVTLRSFTATATADAPRARLACTVRLPVYVPAGFQLGIGRLSAHGDTEMPAGASGHAVLRFFVAGQSSRAAISAFTAGDGGDAASFAAESPEHPDGDLRWLPCDESPTLVAQVDLIARMEAGAFLVDAAVARVTVTGLTLPGLRYKRCAETPSS